MRRFFVLTAILSLTASLGCRSHESSAELTKRMLDAMNVGPTPRDWVVAQAGNVSPGVNFSGMWRRVDKNDGFRVRIEQEGNKLKVFKGDGENFETWAINGSTAIHAGFTSANLPNGATANYLNVCHATLPERNKLVWDFNQIYNYEDYGKLVPNHFKYEFERRDDRPLQDKPAGPAGGKVIQETTAPPAQNPDRTSTTPEPSQPTSAPRPTAPRATRSVKCPGCGAEQTGRATCDQCGTPLPD